MATASYVDHGFKKRFAGSFTPDAAASTTVTDANVTSTSYIVYSPMNSAARELAQQKVCWISTAISDGSFTFTVSASAASLPGGDEIFHYIVFQNS